MNLLVIKPTALGDVAQALKVVPWLKHTGRAKRITWLVDADYAAVPALSPEIDHILPFPRRAWRKQFSPRALLQWAGTLREERFDVVLDLQGLARSAVMTRLARTSRRVGLASSREGARLAYSEQVSDTARHAVDRYAQAVAHVAGVADSGCVVPATFPPPQDALPGGLESGRYTVFHPYSLWETKLWSWDRFRELEKTLHQSGEHIVWVGAGPYFPSACDRSLDLRGRTSLDQLLALLGHARAVISTDSGPAHLAALFDVPVISLFGATDPALTGPRAARGEILTASGPACRPCRKRACAWDEPMACLSGISVRDVSHAWTRLVQAA